MESWVPTQIQKNRATEGNDSSDTLCHCCSLFFFLTTSAFEQQRKQNDSHQSRFEVNKEKSVVCKSTKETDNEMGQINQISIDQVKDRQRF